MKSLLNRLVREEEGQDLIEYALLAALVAIASVAAIKTVLLAMQTTYVGWNTKAQNCWQMPPPGAGSGC